MKTGYQLIIAAIAISILQAIPSSVWAQQKQHQGPTIDEYFIPSAITPIAPDADGFIHRWLLLDPINKPNRSNDVFTDSYIKENLGKKYDTGLWSKLPKNGQQIKVDNQKLTWHALDSKRYNIKLFRFASGRDMQVYGVIFQAITVIECTEDMPDVRLAVGSNSASMWWLNGKQVLMLSGDRRMVQDDVLSSRISLHQGRNILRGAVINGPGMSDFCARLVNEKGQPITNYQISIK